MIASCIQKRLVFKRVFESRASWIQEHFVIKSGLYSRGSLNPGRLVFKSVLYLRASGIQDRLVLKSSYFISCFFQVVNKGLTSYRDPGSAPGRGQKTLHITAADMDLTKVCF